MRIFEMECEDKRGAATYDVSLLMEFGRGEITPRKIAEIWSHVSKYKMLFSDYTFGDPEVLVTMLLNTQTVWFEVVREEELIGALYLSRVIPNFDAWGHFTFWDGAFAGREPLIWAAAVWSMERYRLHRLSTEVPESQHAVLRMSRHLGFVEEGRRREGVIQGGKWLDLIQLGMLKSELDELWENCNERLSIRWIQDPAPAEWLSTGDEGSDWGFSGNSAAVVRASS